MASMWEQATRRQEIIDDTLDVLDDLMSALEHTEFPTENVALWQRLTTVFDELQDLPEDDDDEGE